MRVAVFAARQVPKHVIYSALDVLHGEGGLHVISWNENHGGSVAADWAVSRPGASVTSISSVNGRGKRFMGTSFDSRAAIICIFKVHAPDRSLIFGSPYWIASGVGRTLLQQAERWGVPTHLYAPEHIAGNIDRKDHWKDPPTSKEVALCEKKNVSGTVVCSRLKGHPSAWHWSMKMGERVSKFWLP